MKRIIIKGARIIESGKDFQADVLIEGERITRIDRDISHETAEVLSAEGLILIPGLIDDQVHFREPGLTHKAQIATESRAAAAGGITSFMEMPNTVPQALTQKLLADKFAIGAQDSRVNYSFFMGTSNDNIDEVLKTDFKNVCGLKIFMGSSTGDMLVDSRETLETVFSQVEGLIAVHCEDEARVRARLAEAKDLYGDDIPIDQHPIIRDAEACHLSSSLAVELAKEYGTRLHILHISTAKETQLFDLPEPGKEKRITAEACVHHLWFSDEDYAEKGAFIKWNPAVKSVVDRDAIREAVNNGRIDVLATDHAPHTIDEKSHSYLKCPSGGPLVQHALPALLDLYHQGVFSLETIVERACHAPARLFDIVGRGHVKEGYQADLVLVDLDSPWTVSKENILYKCGWSPFEGHRFKSQVAHTFVNGEHIYEQGTIHDNIRGQRLRFDR